MAHTVSQAMWEYFTEWKKINDNIEPASGKDCVESLVDESERASEFLASVGFENIVSTIRNGVENREMYEDLETFLTKNQMATIRKRVDTLRKKGGGRPARKDVRSLFLEDRDQHQKDVCEEEPKLHGKRNIQSRSTIAECNLVGSSLFFPPFIETHTDKCQTDGAHVHEQTVLPVFYPDKATNICLEKTQIDDLGRKDLKMLEALAQIELMGVFDKFKVDFTKQKSKRKIKDKDGIFGVRLQTLLERDCKSDPSSAVPKFFHQLLSHMEKNNLNEEGILRLSGSYTRIKEMRNEIDAQWSTDNFSFENVRPNDASGLMKVFLRDLPAPLLTFEWIDSFIQISKIPNIVMQIYCLSLLMLVLPAVNRNTLKRLLEFLRKVTEHRETNLMSEDNVAMIMAPNLFLVGPSASSSASSNAGNSATGSCSDLDKDLLVATMTTNVVLLMIKHLEEMFVVPAGLISQIREKNQENKRKAMKKFWGKKEKSEPCRLPEKIQVTIQLDSHSEEATFKLRPDSTAMDVLCSLASQMNCGSEPSTVQDIASNFSLFEIGGNIEARRLDPASNLCGIVRVNPSAKFVFKKKSAAADI